MSRHMRIVVLSVVGMMAIMASLRPLPAQPDVATSRKAETQTSFPQTAPATRAAAPFSLTIAMNDRQSDDQPVIFFARIVNTSSADVADFFDQSNRFKAFLTGPDGRTKEVALTNDSQTEGSSHEPPPLKPGGSVTMPLRLTTIPPTNPYEHVPSEQVFLSPGRYTLRLQRGWYHIGDPPAFAEDTKTFTVVKDPQLAQARQKWLANPPADSERFAAHVRETTLTPELRKEWYRQTTGPCTQEARLMVYRLSIIRDPPEDVKVAMAEALKVHTQKGDPKDKLQSGLLNNAVQFAGNFHCPGAGPALMKLILGNFTDIERSMALASLYGYYEPAMADELAGVLKDKAQWVSLGSAKLLAWAGDGRGLEVLLSVAKSNNEASAHVALAVLAYLPDNAAATQLLKSAMESDDRALAGKVRREMATLRKPQSDRAPWPPAWIQKWADSRYRQEKLAMPEIVRRLKAIEKDFKVLEGISAVEIGSWGNGGGHGGGVTLSDNFWFERNISNHPKSMGPQAKDKSKDYCLLRIHFWESHPENKPESRHHHGIGTFGLDAQMILTNETKLGETFDAIVRDELVKAAKGAE